VVLRSEVREQIPWRNNTEDEKFGEGCRGESRRGCRERWIGRWRETRAMMNTVNRGVGVIQANKDSECYFLHDSP
jgi:hypothetical protein